jgi:hypothetical protein
VLLVTLDLIYKCVYHSIYYVVLLQLSHSCYNFGRVNQALFSASTNVDNYASGKHVRNVRLPTVSSTDISEEEQVHNSGNSKEFSIKPFVVMNHQIPNRITLSLLPKSQWQSLTNHDIIKVCNLVFTSVSY